eukprot:CFRG4909T1
MSVRGIAIVNALLQEISRYGLYYILRAERKGTIIDQEVKFRSSKELIKTAVVCGLGFGVISVLVQWNGVLRALYGLGSLSSPGCHGEEFALISAFTCSMFVLMNVQWMVTGLLGYHQNSPAFVVAAGVSHICSSVLTYLYSVEIFCVIPLMSLGVVFAMTSCITMWSIRQVAQSAQLRNN